MSFPINILRPLLLILFFITACSEHDTIEVKANKFMITYSNTNTIKDGDWIEIDDVRFTHFQSITDAEQNNFSLPASMFTDKEDLQGPVEAEPYTGMGIGIMLGQQLGTINRTPSKMTNHNHKYIILNRPLMLVFGSVQFMREDSTEITIRTSDNYPAKIESLEMD